MTLTGAEVVRAAKLKLETLRAVGEADQAQWVAFGEFCRSETAYLPWLEKEHPEIFEAVEEGFQVLSVDTKDQEWRSPIEGVGGRAQQLLPGTPGSFSDRTDWATWLLMGGRGSGKSRTGAEAVRELLFGRVWAEDPQVAFVSKTLLQVRLDMFERIFRKIIPEGTEIQWNRSTCEMWVDISRYDDDGNWVERTAYIKGFSSEAKDALRGPNHHIAWCDEIATWVDANECSPNTIDSTWSNMKLGVRLDDQGTMDPVVIATTTPKPVSLIRNIDPDDAVNPGVGLYDDASTVVSHMSTEANRANLSSHWWDIAVEPLRGTRLWEQEILGVLGDDVLGALWSDELIAKMTRPETWPTNQGRGLKRIVIGVDPSVGAGLGDECGIIVAGVANDGIAYILEDLSIRAKASVWCEVVADAYDRWGAVAVIVETNQGGELVEETLGRYAPNLPVVAVFAKVGKLVRAEPVALLSDQDRVRFADSEHAPKFGRVQHQMKTWDGSGPSPDRLDALVYAIIYLLPASAGATALITVVRGGTRRALVGLD